MPDFRARRFDSHALSLLSEATDLVDDSDSLPSVEWASDEEMEPSELVITLKKLSCAML